MTKEMHGWDDSFQNFLITIDSKYAAYFEAREEGIRSITKCFATLNGASLKYFKPSNLRADILTEVVAKHKEIWGEWHHYAELS